MTNEKDKADARELVAKWRRDIGQVVKYERMESNMTDLLATRVKEAREEAFTAIGLELRRCGANIRKVDLLARFQELFRELESNG